MEAHEDNKDASNDFKPADISGEKLADKGGRGSEKNKNKGEAENKKSELSMTFRLACLRFSWLESSSMETPVIKAI